MSQQDQGTEPTAGDDDHGNDDHSGHDHGDHDHADRDHGDHDHGDDEEYEPSWISTHIGRLSGGILGGIAIGFLAFLAVLGFEPAIGVLVVIVAGVSMIAIGGAMRGR